MKYPDSKHFYWKTLLCLGDDIMDCRDCKFYEDCQEEEKYNDDEVCDEYEE